MPRRERDDDRPPVEVWGAEPAADESVQQVEVDGRRRRAVALAVGAAIAVVVVGLALDGGDDGSRSSRESADQTTTTAPSSTLDEETTSTAPPTTLVFGPVVPDETGGAVLLATRWGQWTWLDLGSGVRREVHIDVDEPTAVLPVRGGVVIDGLGAITFQPLPVGKQVLLARSTSGVMASGSPDAVWLVSSESAGQPDEQQTATLVDLRGHVLRGPITVPSAPQAIGTELGIAFTDGGRTYLASEDGLRALAVGEVVAASARQVVIHSCDEAARCALTVLDLDGGEPSVALHLDRPRLDLSRIDLSPDGRTLAVVRYVEGGAVLELRRRGGQLLGQVETPEPLTELAWLPDDQGLVAASTTRQGADRIWVDGEGIHSAPVRALADRPGDVIYVIPG